AGAAEPSEVSIRLTAVFGVTIPVIVRHGQTTARVSLSDLQWEMDPATRTPRALSLRIGRTGSRSVYGDVTVSLVTADGREQIIGSVNGIAVYTPNAYRRLEVPVQVPPGSLSRGARLRVTYRNGEDSGNRILAQVEVGVL
ncbi:MAG: molecular chaperone, partial [Bacillota bacterium]